MAIRLRNTMIQDCQNGRLIAVLTELAGVQADAPEAAVQGGEECAEGDLPGDAPQAPEEVRLDELAGVQANAQEAVVQGREACAEGDLPPGDAPEAEVPEEVRLDELRRVARGLVEGALDQGICSLLLPDVDFQCDLSEEGAA